MPSLVHDGLLELLQHRPDLAFRLARAAGLPVLERHDHFESLPRAFVDPSEPKIRYEADLVVVGLLMTSEGPAIADALDVEIQLGIDPRKCVSLPIYRAGVHSKTRRPSWPSWPSWSIMVSPVPRVHAWVEHQLFPREPELRPGLVGPAQVLPPLDPDEAREDPEWAILRAVLHARSAHAERAARVARHAIVQLPEPRRGRYRLLIEATRTTTRSTMDLHDTIRMPDVDDELSDFEKEGIVYQSALREGLEQGREQGREQGLERGLVVALVDLLESFGHTIDDELRAGLSACRDTARLRAMLRHAPRVSHPRELLQLS